MIVKFKDEDTALRFAWLFEPMGWRNVCAGGYCNAWEAPQ